MRRGFVFSLDAVFALYVAMLAVTSFVILLEVHGQSGVSQTNVEMFRLARDVYEVRQYNPAATLPSWLSESCSSAAYVGSVNAVYYKSISGNVGTYAGIDVKNQKVCVVG
jgi:hypothetical protein